MELYWRIAVLLIAATIFGFLPLFVSYLVSPKKPDSYKLAPYECGVETIGPTWVQIKAHYYLFALAFVVFDVEAVFLFPWAVAYNQLGLAALIAMFTFLAILVVPWVYAWKKGALEWK